MPRPVVCPEHSGIVTWLKMGGILFSLFMLILIGISTTAHLDLQKYKVVDAEKSGAMNASIEKVNGSVNVLKATVTLRMDSVSDNMVDLETSNKVLAESVTNLVDTLERNGIFAQTRQDSSILLVQDFR